MSIMKACVFALMMDAGERMAGPVAAPKARESIVKTNPRLLLERLDAPAMVTDLKAMSQHANDTQAVGTSAVVTERHVACCCRSCCRPSHACPQSRGSNAQCIPRKLPSQHSAASSAVWL